MAKTEFFASDNQRSEIHIRVSENKKFVQIFSSENIAEGKQSKAVINLSIDDTLKFITGLKEVANKIVSIQ